MDSLTFSEARAHLKEVMDRVVAGRTPVRITRRNADDVVLIAADEWAAIEDTLHLLSSSGDARLLLDSIAELDALGRGGAGEAAGPLALSTAAAADFQHWEAQDPEIVARIAELIQAILRDPYHGMGQPVALREPLGGWWSRRIERGCRLVYRVTEADDGLLLEIARCR